MEREMNSSTCYMCGKTVVCARPIEICSECGDEMRRRRDLDGKRERLNNKHLDMAEFEMVRDMIEPEVGGFYPGAKITKEEMVNMLSLKVLANGTTVRHLPTDTLWHVDYERMNNGNK